MSIALSIEALMEMGAKTMYMPGIFPIGRTPRYLFLFPGDVRDPAKGCLWWLNDLALVHNRMLKSKLDELRHNHPNISITYVDYYGEVPGLVTKPTENGFGVETVLNACYPILIPGRAGTVAHDTASINGFRFDGPAQSCVTRVRRVSRLTQNASYRRSHGVVPGPVELASDNVYTTSRDDPKWSLAFGPGRVGLVALVEPVRVPVWVWRVTGGPRGPFG
ncbi:hypothetical protein VPH35_049597 [Triticum aestivum]|uniref:Uncharacterized protein n=1 Tax=Triticum aestivum TaxID=4565 RepID=A0A077RPV1_WHEAT|nr:unnamed protein product [Triticum aestivum]